MKICLLGETHGPLDEAMRNTTYTESYLKLTKEMLSLRSIRCWDKQNNSHSIKFRKKRL